MALRTTGDILSEVLVRNNRTTTDGFITDAMLQGWLDDAHAWAAGHKKWPMTEGKFSTTASSTNTTPEGYIYISYPEGWRSDSIRLMTVGGKRLDKKNFFKFQSFMEDNPGDTSKIYTDYARQVLINPNCSEFSGTVVMWGQFMPILDVTDYTATTIFSDADEDGNEAIVEKMSSYLHTRDGGTGTLVKGKPVSAALIADQNAVNMLERVFSKISEEQFNYKDTLNEGWLKRFDVLRGGFKEDIFRRDQWGL